jgi:tetratricopeptide (TPR) repeat protein
LPLLIKNFIQNNKNKRRNEIDFRNMGTDNYCNQIISIKKDLKDDEQWNLNRLAILIRPPNDAFIKEYLKYSTKDWDQFIERLSEHGLFDKETAWFNDQVSQKCFENQISENRKKEFHKDVSNIYKQMINKRQENKQDYELFFVEQIYAYHLHKSGNYYDSFIENKKIAKDAVKKGYLDVAERCYSYCIEAASEELSNPQKEKMCIKEDDKIDCYFNLVKDVYQTNGRYNDAKDIIQNFIKPHYEKKQRNLYEEKIELLRVNGNIDHYLRNYADAIDKYKTSSKISEEIGNRQLKAKALNNIGFTYFETGNYRMSMQYFEESLNIAEEIGNEQLKDNSVANVKDTVDVDMEEVQRLKSTVFINIGEVHLAQGEYKKAMDDFKEFDNNRKKG